MARVPAPVEAAIQNARAADWNVSIRNEKVLIQAPDGKKLTIGIRPNDESLKHFIRETKPYNLIDGPARTPAEAEALLKEAEEEARKKAEEANKKRAAYEAEQARKKAEAEAAAAKAAAAIANGLKTQTKPQEAAIPVQTASSKVSKNSFPEFDKALMGTMDYSKLQLPNGSYYCIECLSEGIEFTARKPQGLATHRGFRHQMYQGENVTSSPQTDRVALPGDIQDAVELLRSVIADHMGTADDSAKVAELEAVVKGLREDLAKADADYRALKKSSDEALEAAKVKIHQLTEELTGKEGRQRAETESLMKSFQGLLKQISDTVNNLAPVKAVAQVDELVAPYLKS